MSYLCHCSLWSTRSLRSIRSIGLFRSIRTTRSIWSIRSTRSIWSTRSISSIRTSRPIGSIRPTQLIKPLSLGGSPKSAPKHRRAGGSARLQSTGIMSGAVSPM